MHELFTKIGFNGSTVCEIDYDSTNRTFNIFWMNREHENLIKIDEYNKCYSVNEWLDALCVLLGYDQIETKSAMVLKPKTRDYTYFKNILIFNRSWDGFHNYHPDYIFEFNITSTKE